MVKIVYCVRRRAGVSVEDYQNWLLNVHAPIVKRIPGLRRYVQSHKLRETYGREPGPTFDTVSEMWFDDLDAVRLATKSDEARAALEDDVEWVDMDNLLQAVTVEHVVFESSE